MVARVLWVYVLSLAAAVFWPVAHAATVPARLPVNVSYNAGAYTVNGAAAAGAVGAASTVSVSGAIASIPVSYRLGELAGIAARTAIRGNAIMLGVQVVSDYLLPYGIKKCQDSGWCTGGTVEQAPNGKPYPVGGGYWNVSGNNNTNDSTPQGACTKRAALDSNSSFLYTFVSLGPQTSGQFPCVMDRKLISTGQVTTVNNGSAQNIVGCVPGHTLSNGICTPPGYVAPVPSAPAGDADWAKVPTTGIPDGVMTAVMQQGQFSLPAIPDVSTQVQTIPMSGTYKDPTTGVSYRDYAYVTGNPNDPQTATLQIVKTKVDPATGNPVTDPTTGNTTGSEKPEDLCASNPNRVGCMDKGDIPPDPDLLKSEKTISITPDTGWGADTMACPADLVLGMRSVGAQPAVFSFKPVCDGADMFRPVIIGMAWLAAVLIALSAGKRGD